MKKRNYLLVGLNILFFILTGCEKQEESIPKPVASFTMSKSSALVDETITFTNTSENAASYEWTFGDGSTSIEKNAIYAFSSAGSYTITLTALGEGGENSVSKSITITIPVPVAGFSVSKNEAGVGDTISFTNSSVNALTYSWDFGDGNMSAEMNPSHTYSQEGTYTIKLTATGDGGTDMVTKSVTIVILATDFEGNIYHAKTIGTQVWMTENLKSEYYGNGEPIGTTSPDTLDISGESTPKYQWAYGGDESNVEIYGRLYTWIFQLRI